MSPDLQFGGWESYFSAEFQKDYIVGLLFVFFGRKWLWDSYFQNPSESPKLSRAMYVYMHNSQNLLNITSPAKYIWNNVFQSIILRTCY